jgi:peptide/nickel transport system ATP-binding protein
VKPPQFSDQDPLLRVSDLVVDYGAKSGRRRAASATARPAVDKVSFELDAGETLAIVGESGSGKTTVGSAVARIIAPTSGSVRYRGVEVSSLPPRQLKWFRSEVQVVFQDPHTSLNPRMRIEDLVGEPLRLCTGVSGAELRRRVLETLDEVGLHSRVAHRYPRELSGGQRQRVVIGRALVMRPSLVVCDEPTSALDVSVQAQIMVLLRDLQVAHRLAFIFVTHNLAILPPLGGQVAVMREGVFDEMGPVEKVLRSPEAPYTAKLLGSLLDSGLEADPEGEADVRPRTADSVV